MLSKFFAKTYTAALVHPLPTPKTLSISETLSKEDNPEGGLHVPSQSFLDYITSLEDSFVKNFSVYTNSKAVGGQLLRSLETITITFKHCSSFPIQYMLKHFLRMHIHYAIKFANRSFESSKKSRKYSKVTHL